MEYIDRVISKTKPYNVSHGEAIAVLILNALGFHCQTLYLVLEYIEDNLIDLLIAHGIDS